VVFGITITGAPTNLHSGIYGGMIFEPMSDLIAVLSSLVNSQAQILVPGVNSVVPEVTEKEYELFEAIDYSVDDLVNATGGVNVALSEDKVTLLMGRMRFPTLTIHSIDNGDKVENPGDETTSPPTVIAHKVIAKFSMRLVPNQDPEEITELVKQFVREEFATLNSKNTLDVVRLGEGVRPWVATPNGPSYQAAARATKAVYGVEPNFCREGGSIGVAITLADAFGDDNVMLLPMGRGDDNPHAPNEKLDTDNYYGGTKVMATYLWEIAYGSPSN